MATLRQACHPVTGGAMCVQRFDDSLIDAVHTTYRILLRSSSMREPRDPLLKVLFSLCPPDRSDTNITPRLYQGHAGGRGPARGPNGRGRLNPPEAMAEDHMVE